MNKYLFLTGAIFFIFIFGNALVSGVCCEKLKNSDMWCQSATNANQCNASYTSWAYTQTCDSVIECSGTCVNPTTGECSEYTDKRQCGESGGSWNEKSPAEISECQEACCLLGQDAYFINPTACRALFTQYNIQGVIRADITSREACEAMRTNLVVGACVVSTTTEKACRSLTNTECTIENIDKLSQYLQNPSVRNEISVRFYEGLLCTASVNGIGISDCAKSTNTECKDNKIYYKDLCGNLANVYDAAKYNVADYWTHIKDPYYSDEICTVTSAGSNSCGNCDPVQNTVCRDYRETSLTKPLNNANGLVCGDLSCKYQGKTYQNLESWCEGTGTNFDITRNLTTSVISKSNLTALKNASKYNLPGSRYYKLICSAGEVTVEECGDYRNSVCIEGKNDDSKLSEASCVYNNWRTCMQIDTKTDCEKNTSLCKWIAGYRWDLTIVPDDQKKERQGSCTPLIAPGFDFWEATSQGNGICAMGTVQEAALFETGIFTSRKKMTGTDIDSWPFKLLANNCLNGCYAIPKYGSEFNQQAGEVKTYPEDLIGKIPKEQMTMYQRLTIFYSDAYDLPSKVKDYLLSTRRGQYCYKKDDPNHWATGLVRLKSYNCIGGQHIRDYPIYLTNQEWIAGITDRGRSMGDCGYKMSVAGKYSAPETEIITAIFQKMKQNGNVKKNLTVEQIIWKAGSYLTGDLEKYETVLPYTSTSYSCAPNYNGVCTNTLNNPALCEGGTVQEATAEGETLCAANMVCCVYPDLE